MPKQKVYMENGIITSGIRTLLSREKFIFVATANAESEANIAPKILIKVDGDDIYLADYVLNKTFKNLKINPQVALGIVDKITFAGYQLKGKAEVLVSGTMHEKLTSELQDKVIELTVETVIRGVRQGQKQRVQDVSFNDQVAIFKVSVFEVVEIAPSGAMKRMQKPI